ncbi:MAG: alpha/beta hydrolase fold domain-containing protein, partial [Aquiluna sp.]|nr:alpha/beta hydrolase fold domain-containing protein [Aquiluna sp.]
RETNLAGLPPAWIGVGDIELFYAEDVAYAKALQAAGVDCKLNVVEGGPHAFETFAADAPTTKVYLKDATSWLKLQLGI